ncbi:FadR/GntR family transcriptional regulator [Pseudooceanicola aestuarii]|uniref:FadR/GntR family transcriptional regulator n=1 Tax=Pseudooceanicola aestuarii TaxID=2697319 RepID=UPI001954170F|nr:FadR/GntR family transcriptional regulator [Pseudooceanicola aestuarii]
MPDLAIQPFKPRPAYQAIFAELQRYIMSGILKPGDPLPTETDLAERFAVNRSTVRESIRQLEAEGLVVRESRKRLVVSVPSSGDLAPRVTRAMVMNEVTFQELVDVAMVLEPMAAEMAAHRATPAEISALEDNLIELEQAIASGGDTVEVDLRFHALLAECTHNRVLFLSREPVSLLLFRSFEVIRPRIAQASARNLTAHRHIVDLVKAGDAPGARRWMERHLKDFERGWALAGMQPDARIDPTITYEPDS